MYTFLKKNNCFQWFRLMGLLAGLSGCVAQGMKLPQTLPEPDRTSAVSSEALGQPKSTNPKRIEALHSLSVLGANHSPKDAAKSLDLPKGKLTLNANGLPLNQFIHLALGDVLHLSFEVDAAVTKRVDPVTLHVGKGIPADRLLGLVEESLNLFGVVVLRGEHGLRVAPDSILKALPASLAMPGEHQIHSGQVAEVIPLKYLKMSELQSIAGSIFQLGKYGRVNFNTRLNAVVAIGDASRVARFKQFIDFLDRPSFEHRQLRLVRPIYWQASDLAKTLMKMLKVQGIPVSDKASQPGAMIVLPIKPINALLVASPHSDWMQQAVALIEHLDGPDAAGAGVRTFIYFTRYRAADELGALISAALGSATSVAKQPSSSPSAAGGKSAPAQGQSSAIAAKKTRGLTVVVDKKRSALIFMGTSRAYQQVVPILERLDIPARQVLIEITIADVSLDNTDQLGVEWQFNNVDNSSALTGTLSTLGGLGVGSAGLTYALANKLGNVRAKINALATKGKAKILSSPTLLAMDGESAHMQVGTQISVVTQEVSNVQAGTGTGTSLLRSFQYIDTGVILDISPTITDYGSIRMKLKQEVSEPGAGGVAGQPPIFKRIVNTVLVAESGQTVLLGGLITHNEATNTTQVPLLGDIPFIGALFRSQTITDRSTELIILITPHVIRGRDDAAALTQSYRNRLGW